MSPPDDLDRLSHAELKSLVIKQWEQLVELQRLVAALRDEIARLKGGPGRPKLKPSGMERGTEPKPLGSSGDRKRPRGSTRSKLAIDEERTVKVAAPPRGSRFKGYTSFVVQDLVIRSHVVNFRCERWQTPDGGMMTAPLPAGIDAHFGPELRRFVLAQYHQGQMTVPRLVTLLRSLGIFISKRQVVRLLIEGQDGFLTEARDVLRAGLSSAAWITVDDTGARHKATNGFCTQIGNSHFTWFGTTASKNRLNFLELLRAGYDDYIINAEALAYMRERALAASVMARLIEHPERCFVGQKAWNAHLEMLGISALEVHPNPVMVATEGGMSVSPSAQSSSSRCQSVLLRASRDTSSPSTIPTRPRLTSVTRRWKPSRSAALAPDCPRSLSMTTIRSSGQPSATARSRSAYWRRVLSVFSNTWRSVDWRTYRYAMRDRCAAVVF